jgi:rhodanese-related sulfurtransferase
LEHRLEFISQNILWVLLALGSGTAFLVLTARGPGGKTGLTTVQATMLINRQDAQIIDLRGAEDYAGGHLPEARNIPLEQFEARAGEIEKFKDMPLILVCQNGARSANACKQLQKLGFSKVNSLAGGIAGWRAAGLPVRKEGKK